MAAHRSRIRIIDGRRYIMRDDRPTKELRRLYDEFRMKYTTNLPFHQWLVERGKVH